MEIKREDMGDSDVYPPTHLSLKKKRYRIEKGRLSIFIICGFLLLFLGLLTFEFRYLVFDNNAPSEQSQSNYKDSYQSKDKKFSILKFFKKENDEKIASKPIKPESAKPTDKLDNSAIKSIKDKFTTLFSRKKTPDIALESPDIALESTELVETSQTPLFDKNKHKYSLQIMAIEEESKTLALKITKKLVQEGYQAYTYKTPVKIVSNSYPNGKYFYRIRIGFFQTRGEAKRIGDKIFQTNNSFPQDYYVVKAKNGEYDGNTITYGFQKN